MEPYNTDYLINKGESKIKFRLFITLNEIN